jgi:hypothetical protein
MLQTHSRCFLFVESSTFPVVFPSDALPISGFAGIHPNDSKAQVTIDGLTEQQKSIYKAATTFKDLGL